MNKEKLEQVKAQCRVVVHQLRAIAEVYEVSQIPAALEHLPTIVQMHGERTARLMEYLGDLMNGMDIVTADDEWTGPIFDAAHKMFPLSPPDAQGKGMVRVPVEPTQEMITAASRAFDGRRQGRFYDLWRAMLSAAPQSQSGGGRGGEG